MDGMQAPPIPPDTGSGCHGGRETMLAAATAAGKGEVLERLIADYPRGPHDQPQSMCPACGCAAWRPYSPAPPAASMG
jgi:chlorophyllide a reductase subunit Y